MEHQQDPCGSEDQEKKAGDSPQAKGIGEFQPVGFYLCWEDMKKEIVKYDEGSLEIGIRYPRSEYGPPYHRFRDKLKDSFFHVRKYTTVNPFKIEKL